MKNKNFNQFNDDRIAAARKRVLDLLYLIGSWEKQQQSTKNTTLTAGNNMTTTVIWKTKWGETKTTHFQQSTGWVFIARLKQTGNKIVSIKQEGR